MRKDYILIDKKEDCISGIEFIENYWSNQWLHDANQNSVIAYCGVANEEEYSIMKPYLETLPKRSRLLDAGCGLGQWTAFLTKEGFEVYGVDISKSTIELLRSKFPNLKFAHGDVRNLEFPDNYFDAAFAWGVFEHFEEGLQPCIVESFRVLRPGGYLFLSVPYHNLRHILCGFSRWESWDQFLATALKKNDSIGPNVVRFFQWRLTTPELSRELAIGGFKVLETHPITISLILQRLRAAPTLFALRPGTISYKLTRWFLQHLPVRAFAHMIMGVGQKPGDASMRA